MRLIYPLFYSFLWSIVLSMNIGNGMAVVDYIVLDNISLGQRVRLARIARGWRQLELVSASRLNPADIVNVEHDRVLPYWKVRRVLDVLEISAKP